MISYCNRSLAVTLYIALERLAPDSKNVPRGAVQQNRRCVFRPFDLLSTCKQQADADPNAVQRHQDAESRDPCNAAAMLKTKLEVSDSLGRSTHLENCLKS